jgi:hypothetical protein
VLIFDSYYDAYRGVRLHVYCCLGRWQSLACIQLPAYIGCTLCCPYSPFPAAAAVTHDTCRIRCVR